MKLPLSARRQTTYTVQMAHSPCLLDTLRATGAVASARITASRMHGNALSFHDFTSPLCACTAQLLLTPTHLRGGRAACEALAPLLRHVLCDLVGEVEAGSGSGAPGAPALTLRARSVALVRLHTAPAAGGALAIQRLLSACQAGLVPQTEACAALDCSAEALAELLACLAAKEGSEGSSSSGGGGSGSGGERFALKQALLTRARLLAGLPPGRPVGRQRVYALPRSDLAALEAAEAALPPQAAGALAVAWGQAEGAPPEGAAAAAAAAAAGMEEAVPAAALLCQDSPLHPVHNLPLGVAGKVPSAPLPIYGERAVAGGGGGSSSGMPATALPPRLQRTREQYAHVKKGPQIAWFLAALARLLPQLQQQQQQQQQQLSGAGGAAAPAAAAPLQLVDVGGGRGDLALAVAAAFPHVRVTVLDVNEPSLAAGRARAAALGLQARTHFVAADALEERNSPALQGAHLFMGLHTCGGLTDAIVALALRSCTPFLLVPCCYTKHAGLVARCAGLGLQVEPAAAAAAAVLESPEPPLLAAATPPAALQHATLCRLAESSDRTIGRRACVVLNARRLLLAAQVQAARSGGGVSSAAALTLECLEGFSSIASSRNLAIVASPLGIA